MSYGSTANISKAGGRPAEPGWMHVNHHSSFLGLLASHFLMAEIYFSSAFFFCTHP
jgi:hypothetical protein